MVSVILVIINILLGEKIGWGTLADMACVGFFVDLILLIIFFPADNDMGHFDGMRRGSADGIAVYLYVSSALGCGPRMD